MSVEISQGSPRLSVAERDRRYAAVRQRLQERGVDCVVVNGSNLFYLSNGLPGERFGVLPAEPNEPMMVSLTGRYLIDIPASFIIEAQDWIDDVRAGEVSTVLGKIAELKLEAGSIGIVPGSLSQGAYTQLQKRLPNARLVDVSDILNDVRTCKSAEEIAMIDRANRIFDAAVEAVVRFARPGMFGKEVVQEGIRAMWDAGGDLNSTFGFCFGPTPRQNPLLCELSLERRIQPGDIGTMTAHAHYGGYGGHSDYQMSFGEPSAMHREMYSAVLHVRDSVLQEVRPGQTQGGLTEVYERACKETGFRSSVHSQMHQYGIDIPEFPGPAFDAGDGGRDFVLAPGMIYSISPTLIAPNGDDLMLGGTSLVVTEGGHRELGDRKVDLAVLDA